jgi:deoxyribodipyrimidine photo-lyase
VGNDPREDRYFNILRQAKNYDPKGDYVRQWMDELKSISGFAVNRPDQNGKVPSSYPKSLVPLDKWQI